MLFSFMSKKINKLYILSFSFEKSFEILFYEDLELVYVYVLDSFITQYAVLVLTHSILINFLFLIEFRQLLLVIPSPICTIIKYMHWYHWKAMKSQQEKQDIVSSYCGFDYWLGLNCNNLQTAIPRMKFTGQNTSNHIKT